MARARKRPLAPPLNTEQIERQARLMEPGVRAAHNRHQQAIARLKAIEAEIEAMHPDFAEASKEVYASMQANNEAGSTWIQVVRQLPKELQDEAFARLEAPEVNADA